MSDLEKIEIIGAIILLSCGLFCCRFLCKKFRAFKRFSLLRDFVSRHVKKPTKSTKKAKSMNSTFMSIVEQHLQNRAICDQIVTTGSAYEGFTTDDAGGIHFKELIIRPISGSDIEVLEITDKSDYMWLKYRHGTEPSQVFDRVLNYRYWNLIGSLLGERYLDTGKTIDLIQAEIQTCISESKEMKGKVRLNRQGSIGLLQMDVYPDSWLFFWGPRLYTVDIIPAYKIGEVLYESRPVKGYRMPDTMTWHRTFALQERQKLCQGAKMILRVLKILCKRESDFGNFTSYQLKTVVLHETDANQDWSELMLGSRLADVLGRLEKCLAARNLPHYFLPDINLLSTMPPYAMDYIRHRIQLIRGDENEIVKLLQM